MGTNLFHAWCPNVPFRFPKEGEGKNTRTSETQISLPRVAMSLMLTSAYRRVLVSCSRLVVSAFATVVSRPQVERYGADIG